MSNIQRIETTEELNAFIMREFEIKRDNLNSRWRKHFDEVMNNDLICKDLYCNVLAYKIKKMKKECTEEEAKAVEKEYTSYLKQNNIDLSYKYDCEKCKDTGRTTYGLCDCFYQMQQEVLLNTYVSFRHTSLGIQNLDTTYYGKNKNDYDRIKQSMVNLQNGLNSGIVVIYGDHHTGKSTLINSILRFYMIKNRNVCWTTSNQLKESLLNYKTRNAQDMYSYNSGVFCIDDFGTEMANETWCSALYNFLKERENKITFIISPLRREEIEKKYNSVIGNLLQHTYTYDLWKILENSQNKASLGKVGTISQGNEKNEK